MCSSPVQPTAQNFVEILGAEHPYLWPVVSGPSDSGTLLARQVLLAYTTSNELYSALNALAFRRRPMIRHMGFRECNFAPTPAKASAPQAGTLRSQCCCDSAESIARCPDLVLVQPAESGTLQSGNACSARIPALAPAANSLTSLLQFSNPCSCPVLKFNCPYSSPALTNSATSFASYLGPNPPPRNDIIRAIVPRCKAILRLLKHCCLAITDSSSSDASGHLGVKPSDFEPDRNRLEDQPHSISVHCQREGQKSRTTSIEEWKAPRTFS